jgi:hypothetical protein
MATACLRSIVYLIRVCDTTIAAACRPAQRAGAIGWRGHWRERALSPPRTQGEAVVVLGNGKGHTPDEMGARNHGMPSPAGYRTAMRLMKVP